MNAPGVSQIYQVPLSAPVLHLHKYVTLERDFLFINGLPFLTSQIRKIKPHSIERTN